MYFLVVMRVFRYKSWKIVCFNHWFLNCWYYSSFMLRPVKIERIFLKRKCHTVSPLFTFSFGCWQAYSIVVVSCHLFAIDRLTALSLVIYMLLTGLQQYLLSFICYWPSSKVSSLSDDQFWVKKKFLLQRIKMLPKLYMLEPKNNLKQPCQLTLFFGSP